MAAMRFAAFCALLAFLVQPTVSTFHDACDASSADPSCYLGMIQLQAKVRLVEEDAPTSGPTLQLRQETGYRVYGHTALGSLTVHGLQADRTTGTCGNATVALEKVKDLLSERLHSANASKAELKEDEDLGAHLIKGETGETELHEMEDLLDHANLNDAIEVGELITINDMDHLVECELGEHSVRLEEHNSTGKGQTLVQGDMCGGSNTSEVALLMKAALEGRRWAGDAWPNGVIPWCYAPDATEQAKTAWTTAIAQLEQQVPCLHFTEIPVEVSGSTCTSVPSIILTTVPDDGCWSYVGAKQWSSSQELNLGVGCESAGTAAHEIGHALGMAHEQSRPDRDKFVSIHYSNIKESEWSQYDINDDAYTDSPYDLLSLMHYSATAFSAEGDLTIEVNVDRSLTFDLGQHEGFSQLDIEHIAEMYGCPGSATPIAQNGALAEALAEKVQTIVAPVTNSGCMCRLQAEEGELMDECASSFNGGCCSVYNNKTWCYTDGDCYGDNWDYCTPRTPSPELIAPESKTGCTCKSGTSCATAGNGYCCNSDDDPKGAWCYTTDECKSDWDYCNPPEHDLSPPPVAPATKSGCTCTEGTSCASFGNGYCCNSDDDAGGAWCFTTDECDADWDYCNPPDEELSPPPVAPATKSGCTCTEGTSCASESNGFCCNSDDDAGGAWCFTTDGCDADWDYCTPPDLR